MSDFLEPIILSPPVTSDSSRSLPPRVAPSGVGFTVLELLVSISIVSSMAALLLPAVQSAREASRVTQCQNNLRQLGVSLHSRYMVRESFPAGWRTTPNTSTAYGWASSVLSQLELNDLAERVSFGLAISDSSNDIVRDIVPAVFTCPSDIGEPTFALFQEEGEHEEGGLSSEQILVELPRANYLGVFGISDPDAVAGETGEGVFIKDRELKLAHIPNGTSHVLFVGERTSRKLPATWLGIDVEGEDAVGRIVGQAYLGPNRDDADECEFDSRHPGGANFLYGDGHVKLVTDDISPQVYRQAARRGDD